MTVETKLCHACRETKPAKDFYKSSSSKDGLAPSCKDCQNGRTPSDVILANAKKAANKAQDTAVASMKKYVERNKATPKPTSSPTVHQSVPLIEPDESAGTLRTKDLAWWNDPKRKQLLNKDLQWLEPRAVWITSVNHTNGTAMVSYFEDGFSRKEVQSLAQLSELSRRAHHY